MKRLACVAFFLLSVSPLLALQTNLIDDVIRMSRSGVADETIIEFVQASRERLDVSADDVIAMNKAGVSEQVIKAVIAKGNAPSEAAKSEAASAQPADQSAPTPETTGPAGQAEQPGCLTFDPPISLAFPYYGPLYPPQLWDPYWYMPRLDTKSAPPVTTERAARGSSEARPSSHPSEARPSAHHSEARPSPAPEHGGNHSSPSRRK